MDSENRSWSRNPSICGRRRSTPALRLRSSTSVARCRHFTQIPRVDPLDPYHRVMMLGCRPSQAFASVCSMKLLCHSHECESSQRYGEIGCGTSLPFSFREHRIIGHFADCVYLSSINSSLDPNPAVPSHETQSRR